MVGKRGMKRLGLFALILAALSGCAKMEDFYDRHVGQSPKADSEQTAQSVKPRVEVRTKPAAADEVLAYLTFFRQLPSPEQKIEVARLRDSLQNADIPEDRLRLALVLAQPGSSLADREKALALIAEHLKDNPGNSKDPGLDELARLLAVMLNRQQELQQQLQEEQKKSEALAQQLNELRNIENIIRQREMNGLPGQ